VIARVGLPPSDGIDAVLLDAGGVLLLPDADAGRRALQALGCESIAEDWHRAHYLVGRALDDMEPIDWPAMDRLVASVVGAPEPDLEEAARIVRDHYLAVPWVPVQGATEALRALGAAGYLLGVVSNAGGTVEEWLAQGRVCSTSNDEGVPPVGVVIDSSVVGIEKPEPGIFHLALEALGVEAERTIYVGDIVRFDVVGAEAAGLQPVHLDPLGSCGGRHCHVSSLEELVEWLAAGPEARTSTRGSRPLAGNHDPAGRVL
jgi:putative hydrolase of the HAD superfamily